MESPSRYIRLGKKTLIGVAMAGSLVWPHLVLAAGDPPSLKAGIAQYNRGYIQKAIPFFEKAVKEAPGSESAWLWLARAYQKQGGDANFQKAAVAYAEVLKANPSQKEALVMLGEIWSWDPIRRADATQLLQRAHQLEPNNVQVAKKLSQALFWQGRNEEAVRVAAPVAGSLASDKAWMKDYAQMLTMTGQSAPAIRIYEETLKAPQSKDRALLLGYAMALHKAGQADKAKQVYDVIAAGGDASDPAFAASMASLAFDMGLYNESVQWDLSLPPSAQRQKDIQLRMARAYAKAYRVPEAMDKFHRLYEAGLLNASEKLEYAEYLRMLHLEPTALPAPDLVERLYQEAQAEDPDSGEISLRLARYFGETDRGFAQTVEAYRQAISLGVSNPEAVEKELLDVIKSNKSDVAMAETMLRDWLAADPGNLRVKTAYAEFLSWQQDRRAEALRVYAELAKEYPEEQLLWEARVEEVLEWHTPTTDLIPVYQELANQFPGNRNLWLTVARAYRNNPDYFQEAMDTYARLAERYPDDATVKKEWMGLMTANDKRRDEVIRFLEKLLADKPADLDVKATYAKLLSYERRYGKASDLFSEVLQKDPHHKDALLGQGFILLWSGRKLKARDYFQDLRREFPDDLDVALALAQAYKMNGRYDEALKILEEVRPLMQPHPDQSEASHGKRYSWEALEALGWMPVGDWAEAVSPLQRNAQMDFSIMPYSGPVYNPDMETELEPEPAATHFVAPVAKPVVVERTVPVTVPFAQPDKPAIVEKAAPDANLEEPVAMLSVPAPSDELQALQSDVDVLQQAINTLELLQASSKAQLNSLHESIKNGRDRVPDELSLQNTEPAGTASTAIGTAVGRHLMTTNYGVYSALDYDTNPILSGLGRFKNDELDNLEQSIYHDLRPMLRGGFMFSTQDGEETTSKFNYYGFPNQLSLSLTPQIRLRGGIVPTRYYIPDGVEPDSTWGTDYGLGATVKQWDRLTLDLDAVLTHFSQSDSVNFMYQAQAEYAFNDSVRAKIGSRRLPQMNSLLSVAGLRPNQGAFRGDLIGQVRETGFYGELNLNPFNPNWDLNLGYEFALVDGERIPDNHRNQAFASLGYTHHFNQNHRARLGYEFLYFGYDENATNGYVDVTAAGVTQPVVSLRPVTLASNGYVFGGYFSPSWFIQNAARLDFRGSLFDKFLEYKLGGMLGVQSFDPGNGINEEGDTSLASGFDANLIMNFTDWLAAYGNVDFIDTGGLFNRWRFGGGFIVRPKIDALSPMFGGH